MAGQSLVYDFIGRGAVGLAQDFRKTGDAASLAARGTRLAADAIEKQRKAASVSAGATLALARADKILEEAEHGLADGALEAEFALKKQAAAAKSAAAQTALAGAAAKGAGGGFSALASPMGAAVAAGVALSPVVVTLAAGLGGLGLAAVGVARNQALMRRELAPLKADYAAFQKSLQPVVLQDLAAGLGIARTGLRALQPVSSATGKALAGVLGQVDAEFRSKTWQNFFTWMGQQAGPDVRLVGNAVIELTRDLPPLLMQLQPVAEGFLKDTDAALKFVGAIEQAVAWEKQHAVAVSNSTGWLGRFEHAAVQAFQQMFPGVKAAQALQQALDKAGTSTAATGMKVRVLGGDAQTAAMQAARLAAAVNQVTGAESKALSPLLAYNNSLITQTNDAANLNAALKASHDRIGLKTAAERASFSAAQTYAQDLLNTASAAARSHQNIDGVIGSLQRELPALEHAKGGTAGYSSLVQQLVGWLNKLKQIKAITEAIHVNGSGVWSVTPGKIGLPGGTAGGPFAAGGIVRAGTTETADDVLIRASRNETVVSAAASRLPFMQAAFSAAGVPGYASGGVVGSYPKLQGLGPWAGRELTATRDAIAKSVAQAMVSAIKAARASGAPGALGGPTSASAAQAQSYAKGRLSAYGWGSGQMPPLIALWNQESGWNRLARNPSSGAYGIPQALPASKMGAAANPPTSSAAAQINWGLGYIRGRYGSPAGAEAHERAYNWYDQGGLLMPGLTMAANGTGRPEHVIPGQGLAGMLDRLQQILGAIQQLSGIVSGASGGASGAGFGLTRSDLGLPATTSTDTGGGDTGTGDDGSGDTSTTPAKPAPKPKANATQKAAAAAVRKLMNGYIWHNKLAQMKQANTTLDYLMDHTYDARLKQIVFLDGLLASAQKKKDKKAEASAQKLLGHYGVHVWKIQQSVKGNTPRATAARRVEALMKGYIAGNDMTSAGHANALLRHWSVTKYTGPIGQIRHLDALLAQYKKAKDTKDVKATQALLRTYGVKKFAAGGLITEPIMGVGASGQAYQFGEAGPEMVTPVGQGGGMDRQIALLEQQNALLRQLVGTAAAIPAATGRHVAAGVNGAAAGAVFRGRYPGR